MDPQLVVGLVVGTVVVVLCACGLCAWCPRKGTAVAQETAVELMEASPGSSVTVCAFSVEEGAKRAWSKKLVGEYVEFFGGTQADERDGILVSVFVSTHDAFHCVMRLKDTLGEQRIKFGAGIQQGAVTRIFDPTLHRVVYHGAPVDRARLMAAAAPFHIVAADSEVLSEIMLSAEDDEQAGYLVRTVSSTRADGSLWEMAELVPSPPTPELRRASVSAPVL